MLALGVRAGGRGATVDPVTSRLLLVRHGESVGNVAATHAEATGADVVDIETRDADTPLSPAGVEQAEAFGEWLAGLPADEAPEALWCSPYVRARRTAELAVQKAGLSLRSVVDDRLRDRELGILDRLTTTGVERLVPDEAVRRRHVGKLYYRPPGGESWADVALRVRSVLRDIVDAEPDRRVLVVCHDAVIWLFRYVCEGLGEAELMEQIRTATVRNASVTVFERAGTGWRLEAFDEVGHLREADAPVTRHPGDVRG